MNILQKLQEQYIQEFNDNIPLDEFLMNILVVALLVSLLRIFYIRFGNSLSNRRKFSATFLPLALSTLLVIMIVKSSIALSLGLVGALSIVRFRAAIKDPEELTYLFFVIGLGLAGGANQPILATVSFIIIISLLLLNKVITKKNEFQKSQSDVPQYPNGGTRFEKNNQSHHRYFTLRGTQKNGHFRRGIRPFLYLQSRVH